MIMSVSNTQQQPPSKKQLAAALNMILNTEIKFEKLPIDDLRVLFTLIHDNPVDLVSRIVQQKAKTRREEVIGFIDRVQNEGVLGFGGVRRLREMVDKVSTTIKPPQQIIPPQDNTSAQPESTT
jgi:hypothetical protein